MQMRTSEERHARAIDFRTGLPLEELPTIPDFLSLDSGARITMDDSIHHAIAFGSTGTGKTADFILPGLKSHFQAGHAGLIVDVKGTLRGLVSPLAGRTGRSDDIVEIGTSPSAMPINILDNMEAAEFYDFCVPLMTSSFMAASHNMDFHITGAAFARDCFQLLKWLAPEHPELTPNLIRIYEMMRDPAKATNIFEYFRQTRTLTDDQKAFASLVDSAQFHPLSQTKEKLKRAGTNHFEQMSYNSHMMVNVLRTLLEAPGIRGKFCQPKASGLDFAPLLKQGKIIALHFSLDTGSMGSIIARMVIDAFYKTIYENGLTLPIRTFVCIDEFAEVSDLSRRKYSDASYAALAREYSSCFMAAAQSAASLIKRAGEYAVREFLSNCNTKVFFFTDDVFTRSLAKAYDEDIDLIYLKPREVFAIRYDSASGKREWGLDGLSKAYASVVGLVPEKGRPWEGEIPAARPLAVIAEELCPDGQEKGVEKRKWMSRTSIRREPTPDDPLIKTFPSIFAEGAHVEIPVGWRYRVRKAIQAYLDMGLSRKIIDIHVTGGNSLTADDEDEGHGSTSSITSISLLRRLLAKAVNGYCASCGAQVEQDGSVVDDDDDDDWDSRPYRHSLCPICDKCAARYALDD